MSKPIVVYTDLPWALAADGTVDPARAVLEREVYQDEFEMRFVPARDGRYELQGAAFEAALHGAHALVIHRCQITAHVLEACGESLQVVGRQGVGYENLAPELLRERGIIGFNVPDYCIDEVAAHTLALILALERGIVAQDQSLGEGRFDIYAGGKPRRLRNCVVGIVGLGRIGRVVSTRMQAFYRRVLACDPYVADDVMAAYGVQKVDLTTLLQESDVVTLHCPLNEETRCLIASEALSQMKPSALLINTARGGLIEAEALFRALTDGRIAGAGLDVYSPENPHDDPWYTQVVRLPKVVATSHRAFYSREGERSQRRRTSEGILHVLQTGTPPAVGHLTG